MESWIKLHRRLLDWEWYKDCNAKVVFIHLLLKASAKRCKYMGAILRPGQLITSVAELSEDLNLTTKQIRTALNRLKTTNEVAIKTTNKFSLVTVANWAIYQSNPADGASKTASSGANKGQAKGKQRASLVKEVKNIDNKELFAGASSDQRLFALLELNDGTKHPVSIDDVKHWKELYPAVDVEQELRSMVGWTEANPQKRKTKRGITSFIVRWLAKEQGKATPPKPKGHDGMRYL